MTADCGGVRVEGREREWVSVVGGGAAGGRGLVVELSRGEAVLV